MTASGNETDRDPAVQVPRLSLCVIAKNERENIARCLTSVRDLVDEMIVVDTGSEDGTQEVSQRLGARVIQSTWTHDFSAARNTSLEHARGRWILVLDADEHLEPSAKDAIRKLVAEYPPDVAFNLINKSTSDGGRTGMIAHLVRLFPNRPDVRYCWPIHEQIAPSLMKAGIRVVDTNVVILHSGYSDPRRNQSKQRRNLAILETQIASKNDVTPLTHFMLAGCHLDLGDFTAALKAYEQCREIAGAHGADDIAAGALVRIVECLVQLRRYADVAGRLTSEPDAVWHPELLTLVACSQEKTGQVERARRTYEIVFGCAEKPRIPACNLSRLKMEALKFLAGYWNARGKSLRAVRLVRHGMALRTHGADFTAEHLARCYAESE